jgi:hypothetical protein
VLWFPGINWFSFSSLKNTDVVHFDLLQTNKPKLKPKVGALPSLPNNIKSLLNILPGERRLGREKILHSKDPKILTLRCTK